MKKLGTILLLGGLVSATAIGFIWGQSNALVPWICAGFGLALGVFVIAPAKPDLYSLLGLTGLTLAIFVIETQWYNPGWLNDVLLYLRVFTSHALLGVGFLALIRICLRDESAD